MAIVHLGEKDFRHLAEARGYSWEDVKECVLAWDVVPGICKVDTEHEKFPIAGNAPLGRGVGTNIKKMLATIGIHATKNCSCNKRARFLDEMGADWCEVNIDMVVDWLAEEASKRRLPFFRSVGKMLVRRAIRQARS